MPTVKVQSLKNDTSLYSKRLPLNDANLYFMYGSGKYCHPHSFEETSL